MPAQTTIRLRQGTATEWTTANPVLASGEQGYEADTKRLKVGDGVSTWSELVYFASSSVTVSPTAPATSLSGDLWFDSTDGQTYIRYVDADSSQWVAVSGTSGSFQLGAITPWAANAIPSWALELTGQAVSRTIYSGLFALLGTSYGAGDGTTTFNIPDYRGRTLVGHDASQTEFDVLGETGGAKTHTMTVAEMPVHRHNLQRPPWKTAERTAGNQFWGPAGGPYIQHTDSGSVQFSGGDEPHNNLQPYTVVKWIICAASSSGNFDTEVQTALVTNVSTLQTGQAALQTSVAAIQTRPIISGQIGTFQHPAAPTKLQFDDFFVSGRGITYNATTRRFTVPTAGVYRVTMNPFKFHSTNPVRVTIGVNDDAPTTGNHRGHAYSSGADYQTLSLNSVVTLAANDFVVFYLAQGSLWNLPGDRFNQFSIEMIS